MKYDNLPNSWTIKKMPEVIKWGSGGTPKATEKSYYVNGTIPWLVIGDLNDSVVYDSKSKITELGLQNSNAKMIAPNTLLVAMYGSIGKLGITGINCCTNQAIAYARVLYGVTTKFMFYYMAYRKPDLISRGKGGTQRNISLTVLNSLDVVVPPLPEQERIVSRIEELFSQLDAGVEALKKVKTQLGAYRQAVLKEAFSVEQATKVVEIREIVEDIRIGPFGTMLHKSDYIKNGIPVINPQHIKAGKIVPKDSISVSVEKAEELSAYKLRSNDIIMGRRGEMGRTAAITDEEDGWICGTGSILFRLKPVFDASFYAQLLSSPDVVRYLQEHATGTTMKNLNEDIVQHIQVPLVTTEFLKEITRRMDGRLSICNNIVQTVDVSLRKAEATRQSILKDAFEGRL